MCQQGIMYQPPGSFQRALEWLWNGEMLTSNPTGTGRVYETRGAQGTDVPGRFWRNVRRG